MSIASASTTVKFHEFPSGTVLHNYQPGSQIDGQIRSISWSKDGNWLALVPHSGLVEIVSVKDQLKLIHSIQCIGEPTCASFQNTTKKNIAVGTKSGQVLLYDIKSRCVKKRFNTTNSSVTHVEFTGKDNHIVAACGATGDVFVYSNVTNVISSTFKIPRSESVSALRTNLLRKNYIAAGSDEGVVAVWDINANKNKFFIGSHKAPVTAVAFSPVSADLAVSAGLDRQFCCYDVSIGKCITNMFVEHNMTSVDFSPDGNFIIMGSQKGKVYIYEAQNLKRPIQTFVAHSVSVKHLLFRKSEDFDSSSMGNTSAIDLAADSNKRNNNPPIESDSFDYNIHLMSSPSEPDTCSQSASKSEQDSFLAEVGIIGESFGKNITGSSCRSDISIKLPHQVPVTSSKKVSLGKFTPNQVKFAHDNVLSGGKSRTSTPNYLAVEMNTPISPIVTGSPQGTCEVVVTEAGDVKPAENLQQVLDGMKELKSELKSEMKYYSSHHLSETRQLFLDLVMTMVKESIKVENNFNNLRAEIAENVLPASPDVNSLLEENFLLKQRIAALEEEVSVLRNNQNHF